jgi:hypothetical protein
MSTTVTSSAIHLSCRNVWLLGNRPAALDWEGVGAVLGLERGSLALEQMTGISVAMHPTSHGILKPATPRVSFAIKQFSVYVNDNQCR